MRESRKRTKGSLRGRWNRRRVDARRRLALARPDVRDVVLRLRTVLVLAALVGVSTGLVDTPVSGPRRWWSLAGLKAHACSWGCST
jgi:hypothetical protein